MKYLTLVLSLAFISSSVWADCVVPDAPDFPDGAKASHDEMIAGQKAVKTFQKANLEYLSCVEEDIKSTEAVAGDDNASDEDKATAVVRHGKAVEAYNAAVTREEKIAGQFNSEVQDYQAANAE